MGGDDRGSYISGSRTDITPESEHRHGRLGKIAAGVGGAGLLAALARRRRSRSRSRSRTRTDYTSHHGSESYVDEKYSEHGGKKKDHTWRDRLLIAGATGGAIAAARRIFGGKRDDRTDFSSESDYSHRPPRPHGAHSVTETDYSRIEEGNRPHTPTGHGHGGAALAALPAAAALAATGSPSRHSRHSRQSRHSRHSRPDRPDHRPAGGSIHSYSSWEESMADSPGKAKRHTHTFRDGIAALGVAGYLRHKWNQRKDEKDNRRIEEIRRQEREEERIAREEDARRRRYTGDGYPRPPPHRRHGSISESELSPLGGSNPELSLTSLNRPHPIPTTPDVTAMNTAANAGNMLTPPPQMPATVVRVDSSGSEAVTSPGGGRHYRPGAGDLAAAGLAGTAAGAAADRHERNSSRRRDSSATSSVNSPQAAVQVKMHNDGRHVTLRRLDPKEKAAERNRRQGRPGRSGSISSGAGGPGASGDEHWRRVERMEQEQAAQMRADAIAAGEAPHNILPPMASLGSPPPHVPISGAPSVSPPVAPPPQPIFSPAPSSIPSNLPPPPPIPASGSNMGGSPGSIYGSGPSNVDSRAESNRRRRRAERARQEAAAREQRGNRVDFT